MAGDAALAQLDFSVITITFSADADEITIDSDLDAPLTNWVLDQAKRVLLDGEER